MPPAHASLGGMTHAILTTVADRPGMLSSLTKVLADHDANITYVDIHSGAPALGIYFEVTLPEGTAIAAVLGDLHKVAGVQRAEETPSFSRIYGKRIIVMGGGAQVGLVAMGAISEADRTTSAASASRSTPSRWSANRSWRTRCAPCRACRG